MGRGHDEDPRASANGVQPNGWLEHLIGRDGDLEFLGSFIDAAAIDGGALLLSGDAGVGKTALLDAVVAHAAADGTRVLRAAGAEFEAGLSFAGLNQVLRPLLDGLGQLSEMHRRALSVALGLDAGAPYEQLVVSNATLALLVQAAKTAPHLVVLDDVPWLDRPSAVVLGFVARRLSGSPVGILAARRPGESTFFERAGLPEYELQPLEEGPAETLLKQRFPAMAPKVRRRLLAEAEGNPLALLELPAALLGSERAVRGEIPAVLPLGPRLRSVFASRVEALPARTRRLLLLSVLDGTGDLRLLQGGASERTGVEGLGPAERARLVQVDESAFRLRFCHPLIRSAIVESSTIDQRRKAHQLIADRRSNQPELRAWHLAQAAIRPDEDVAALLDEVAHRNLRRGDSVGAIAGLLRAAELSPTGPNRSARLAEAAYVGAIVTGAMSDVPRLLDAARQADPEHGGALAGAVAGAYHLLNSDGDVDTAHRFLVGAIHGVPDPTDAHNQLLIEALYNLLEVCFFGGRADLWEPFHAALGRLKPQPPELLAILASTFSDPARLAQGTMVRLEAVITGLNEESNPARIVRTGIGAAYVDRLGACRPALLRVVAQGRDGDAITSAIEALFLLSNDSWFAGRWDEVDELTREGLLLCNAHGYRLLIWPGVFLRALLSAARGDDDATRAMADEMAGWAVPRQVGSVEAYAAHAMALGALGRGDFEVAYQHAAAVSPPGVLAPYLPHALWLILDLTEACVRTGRYAEAARHVATARDQGIAMISSRLALLTRGATAIASLDDNRDLFEAAIATPEASRWPFDLARIQLAYGERLRRTRATADARRYLTSARETFQRLDARPWATRAGNELRATGISVGRPQQAGPLSLTPQQREIASLAAAGLSNKQIGERLFLSHRTIATHLYQLYPKLGISSRAGLRDALKDLPGD
jgi:DNA-binding CsgD family transcriptional regulator